MSSSRPSAPLPSFSWGTLLGQLRLEFGSAIYYRCGPDWGIRPRVMPEEHLHLVHAGRMEYTIGERVYRAGCGNVVFCPPHVTWSVRRISRELVQVNVFHFQARFPGGRRYLDALGFPPVLRPAGQTRRELFQLGLQLARIHREQRPGFILAATALLYRFFHAFYPMRGEPAAVDPGGERVLRVIHHLRENHRDPIALADLSRLAGMSANHLGTIFRRCTGQSPIGYLIQLRLQEARRLLALRGSRVKEVAAAVGYEDPAYFSRLFRKHVGVAPEAYRRQGAAWI